MNGSRNLRFFAAGRLVLATTVVLVSGGLASTISGQQPEDLNDLKRDTYKGQPVEDLLSSGGFAARFGPNEGPPYDGPGWNNPKTGQHDNGRGGNTFVNDPCLDPPPTPDAPPPPPGQGAPSNMRTVQSETELAVLNTPGSMGKKIVAGYNDSWGFYDNRQGLSGYAFSTNGGNTWIDGGGLPPKGEDDQYFGDPVLVVDNSPRTFTVGNQTLSQPAGVFYYSSIYVNDEGVQTLSVNRGQFVDAPPAPTSPTESISNTRCLNHPEEYGIPDPPSQKQERIRWEPPVDAVATGNLCRTIPNPNPAPGEPPFITVCDDLDKEWLYVSQKTGELYVTYTRFGFDGSTPLEMVRSKNGGRTWEGPFVIVPNLNDTFNQATQLVQTPTGRLVCVWHSRTFDVVNPPFPETSQRIEYAFSDNDGTSWGASHTIAAVNPQGEPPGYNRARPSILNAPYITVDKGADDGVDTYQEIQRPGFGNIYVTYFSGKTAFPVTPFASQADIYVSRSTTNGASFEVQVKVNDDLGTTSHVFPSVQVNKNGELYVGWLDRRNDEFNLLTDTWANVSHDGGLTFGHDKLQTDVATSWFVRRDAAPNFGDYNSSELLGFNQFVMTWADGRFPAQDPLDPTRISFQRQATPDVIFSIANGLGVGSK
jgi:hypothetical protein